MPIHVIGPPGTGKTERLINVVSEAIEAGIEPTSIAYISFTRSAITEARHRVVDATNSDYDDLEFFRTMHSMAFRALGLTRDNVVSHHKWTEFCQSVHLRYSTEAHPDDEEEILDPNLDGEEGDVLRRLYDFARNANVPLLHLDQQFDLDELGVGLQRIYWYGREYETWKQAHLLQDFIDMLQNVWLQRWCPPVEMVILDEAQDLSPLQRDVFNLWIKDVPYVYLGYDDDQCIYQWQGADPRWLLNMPGDRQLLRQSFRVPRRPAAIAQRIIARNFVRYPKDWIARDADGSVEYDAEIDDVVARLDSLGGTTMFLARSRWFLRRFYQALTDSGHRFTNLRGPDHRPSGALTVAYKLSQGEAISMRELHLFADRTKAKRWWERGSKAKIERQAAAVGTQMLGLDELWQHGANEDLTGALRRRDTALVPLDMTKETRDYWERVYRRYGVRGLTMTPTITTGTIHSVKGGQADNVVVLPNIGLKTWRAYDDDPEPERRVWYVAASRTRENLIILEPQRGRIFDDF